MQTAGIMDDPVAAVIDVQDMLCAQALAVVAKAADRLASGQALEVLYNAADVKNDLTAWACAKKYDIREIHGSCLRVRKS